MSKMYTDEILVAFADGKLDEPEFTEIALAIETDAALAERVEALATASRGAKAVYGPLADRPVPVELRRAVDAAIRRAERPRGKQAGGWRDWISIPRLGGFAVAASLAAVVAGPVGYLVGQSPPSDGGLRVGAPLGGEIASLVATLPSGTEARVDGQVLRPIASFATATAELCREFELDGATATVAVACREAGTWQVAIALSGPVGGDGYAPAAAIDALEVYIAALDPGPPLTAEEEAIALSAP